MSFLKMACFELPALLIKMSTDLNFELIKSIDFFIEFGKIKSVLNDSTFFFNSSCRRNIS